MIYSKNPKGTHRNGPERFPGVFTYSNGIPPRTPFLLLPRLAAPEKHPTFAALFLSDVTAVVFLLLLHIWWQH